MRLATKLRLRIKQLEGELELQKLIAEQAKEFTSGNKVRSWEKYK
jgi:hypothetical protein